MAAATSSFRGGAAVRAGRAVTCSAEIRSNNGRPAQRGPRLRRGNELVRPAMPIYAFRCPSAGHSVMRRFGRRLPPVACARCGRMPAACSRRWPAAWRSRYAALDLRRKRYQPAWSPRSKGPRSRTAIPDAAVGAQALTHAQTRRRRVDSVQGAHPILPFDASHRAALACRNSRGEKRSIRERQRRTLLTTTSPAYAVGPRAQLSDGQLTPWCSSSRSPLDACSRATARCTTPPRSASRAVPDPLPLARR